MSILKGKQLGIVELTGSLFGTASYAVTASYAMNGGSGAGSTFPFSGSAVITGSLLISGSETITGSLNVTQGITGSLFGTSSWATNAITASYIITAQTASYVLNAVSASRAVSAATASYVLNAVSASFAQTASYVKNAVSASYVLNAISSSYTLNATTASYVNPLNQDVQITGSLTNGASSVVATGLNSHAEGVGTQAAGEASHAEGFYATANGIGSHTEGNTTTANGGYSHAEGYFTVIGTQTAHQAYAINGQVFIQNSDVTSVFTQDSYLYLYDVEFGNIYQYASFLINGVTFNGTDTRIILADNTVNAAAAYVGDLSYFRTNATFGGDKTIPGNYSHTEGTNTTAVGLSSHAEGVNTQAIGMYSHAEGNSTQAIGNYQHVQGTFNLPSTIPSAFILGNGIDSGNKSNLIFAAGTEVQITGSLYVTDVIVGSLSGTSSFALSSSYAQTASSILGGKATHVPYFITDTTLATSSIYQSGSTTIIINQDNATAANPEALYVWQPSSTSINVISGKGNLNNYLQLNIQNTNQGISASSDIVATANNGTETTNYIDVGINSENYSQNYIGAANDAYLYSTGNDLHIGNATPNKPLQFFVGGTDVDIYNKLQLNPNNQHLMSGSLDVSGSVKAFSFTGSLQGNATTATTSQTSSYSTTLGASLSQPANNQVRLLNSAGGTLSTATVNNVTSASYADNASNANYAATAGNGGVTQIIAGSGISLIPSSGQGAVTVISTGGGGVIIISGSLVTGSFTSTNSFTFNHNLSTRTPIITVFDSNYNQIIPQNIELVNTSSAIITFPTPESGFAIGSTGGTTGTALSSSYALFSTYASTASVYAETDPVFVAKSASLATTGSNIFIGNQTITGSLTISGSSTFTNIGPALFTGSVSITGSTTQTGNNTLIGNTVLSGSIGISGSSTIQGTTTMTGSLNITGSTTQSGNNTLIGTTTLTGSIFINGNVIPQISSSFDLGSITNPWRSIYLQSGSISIQSDIPGGIPAVISNANGNVTFTQAGFQLKSGSFVPFEVSSSARTIIRVTDVPANDVGGLSIIGSSNGAYQGITNAGGLLHLTSNDGQSSRITSDAYGTTAAASYVGRKARGTAATPLPVQSGDILTRISSIGWTGPDYGFIMSSSLTTAPTSIDVVALENYTTSSFGSRFNLYSVPLGSTTRTLSTTIDTTGITIPSSSRFFGTSSWASNTISASYAQTASYVRPLVQDVIITGSLKVSGSLTEIGNTVLTGSLTLSSGSSLNLNNGFYVNGNLQYNYGQFSSTVTQSGSADTAYLMTFNTTDFSNGISLVSGSRLTIANTGMYNIQFSSQLHTTANQAVDFSIWFAMTGSDIANSNTDFSIEKVTGGGFTAAALNFLTRIQSGSYVELKYSKTTTQGQLQAKGTQTTPTRPATPSAIVTITQIA